MPGLRRLPRAASQPTQDLGVAVEAIIFDWGGTLTPWHSVDQQGALARGLRRPFPGRPGG